MALAAAPTAVRNAIRTTLETSAPLYPDIAEGSHLARGVSFLFAPFRGRWAYTRALFLLASFPLGLLYFVTLLPGAIVGGVLAWTIPGLALLVLLVVGARWYGDLDALLVRSLVGIAIRRPPTWYERDVPIREQAKQVLSDPSTWTGFVYLFSRFPLGIFAFVSFTVGGALSLVLTFAPAIWVLRLPGTEDPASTGWIDLTWWRIDSAPEAWLAVPVGLVTAVGVLHAWNLLAWVYGWWARLMLGSRARDIPAPPATLEDGPSVAPASAVQHASIASLTPREREVLLLIARGYSNVEIAEAFVVSEGTVKTHVKRILSKLDVRDRTQAAVFAFDSGFVTPESASEPEPR